MSNKAPDAFRTISEVAAALDVPQHVLRFWETKFSHIRPLKRGGGRRYYRPEDLALLRGIRTLLYGEGYTIKGVQKLLREKGVKTIVEVGEGRPQSGTESAAAAVTNGAGNGRAAGPLSGDSRQALQTALSDLRSIQKKLLAS